MGLIYLPAVSTKVSVIRALVRLLRRRAGFFATARDGSPARQTGVGEFIDTGGSSCIIMNSPAEKEKTLQSGTGGNSYH